MSRWEPNARGRLERAAFELFAERGFERTTVADIAERAGLTERTFFRHFADKREVLFAGADAFEEVLLAAVVAAPDSLTPIDAVAVGLAAVAAWLPERDAARRRQAIIAANPELQERELIKMASVAGALGEALRRRGVEDPTASLTAQVGIACFRTAFERWVGEGDGPDLATLIRDSLDELKVLSTAR